MTEVNSMYHAECRRDGLKAQIDKLEGLAHHTVDLARPAALARYAIEEGLDLKWSEP